MDYSYVWLIPWIPFVGFLINGLFGSRIKSEKTIGLIGSLASTFSFFVAFYLFLDFINSGYKPAEYILFDWIQVGGFKSFFGYRVDQLSITMALIVTFVGSLIHYYSIGYMHGEKGFFRFFAYLNLFMFSMLNLVLANNILLLFLGWEGVGVCSYLLIGFYYEDDEELTNILGIKPSVAGMKAFIVNRIGDAGFLIGIFLTFYYFGTINFAELNKIVLAKLGNHEVSQHIIDLIAISMFVGATGKSAQIPLYVWLPDAMAGPTPVSALIHAATMVTAGVFMIGRMGVIYLNSPLALTIVAIVGALTAFFAATMGTAQNDIKKVLAYSTISQLGYMFLGMGVGAFSAGIFHLMTHAFFKALLFLGSGSVILALHHKQDLRYMGGLRKYIKITFYTFLVATLAISGIPGFSGFFSKDEILAKTFNNPNVLVPWLPKVLWAVGAITAGLTAFYMFRLLFLAFYGEERMDEHTKEHIHESPAWMTVPLIILAFFSVVAGYVGLPEFVGKNVFGEWLNPVWNGLKLGTHEVVEHHAHHSLALELGLMGASIGLALIGIFIAYSRYIVKGIVPPDDSMYKGFVKIVYRKYYVDEFYNATFVNGAKALGNFFWKKIDLGIIDGFINGLAKFIRFVGDKYRKVQTGIIHDYVLSFVIGVVFVVGFIIYYVFR